MDTGNGVLALTSDETVRQRKPSNGCAIWYYYSSVDMKHEKLITSWVYLTP